MTATCEVIGVSDLLAIAQAENDEAAEIFRRAQREAVWKQRDIGFAAAFVVVAVKLIPLAVQVRQFLQRGRNFGHWFHWSPR